MSSDRKLSLIAPLTIGVAVIILIGVSLLLNTEKEPVEPAFEPVIITPVQRHVMPAPPQIVPPLSRTELIREADRAAEQFATNGAPSDKSVKDPLVGRNFRVRIAFDCGGPQLQAANSQAFTVYDPNSGTVRITGRPGIWTTLPMIQALPNAAEIESVEGFWLPRTWSLSEACPLQRDGQLPATPTPPSPPTLGLAEIFSVNASRLQRRENRPYEYLRQIPKDDLAPLSHFYWLVLEGHIVGFPSGRAINCWNESAEHRPVCLYGVAFDRIAFEDGVSGENLVEWLQQNTRAGKTTP